MMSHKIKIIFVCIIFTFVCGDDITRRLLNRFNDVRKTCVDKYKKETPAFMCSGLMLRGLANVGGKVQKFAWSKKESNKESNAFSVTFLRRDLLFKRFPHGYESGFIYYPHNKTPKGKNRYTVFCMFPLDAWTDYREGKHGCGRWSKDTTGKSEHCDVQGITTRQLWIDHYKNVTKDKNKDFGKWQCGFDTTIKDATKEAAKKAARNLAVGIDAKRYLLQNSEKYGWKHTELRVKGWNENRPEKMPIEAFFYLIGYKEGQDKANKYQRDYFKLTGEKIPTVGIQLPTQNNKNFTVRFP